MVDTLRDNGVSSRIYSGLVQLKSRGGGSCNSVQKCD
jgi:hypothetical protein